MITIVIPFKNTNKDRERNIQFVINHYKKYIRDCHIVVCEQDSTTELFGINQHLKFNTNNDSFRKSFLFNQGYNASSTRYIIFADADCVVDSIILENIEQHQKLMDTGIVLPYNRKVYYLTEEETINFVSNKTYDINQEFQQFRLASGGVVMTNCKNFYDIGGFDERFKGWGVEDDAFFNKAIVCGLSYNRLDANMVHLYHSDVSQNYDNYSNNIKLYNEIYGKYSIKEIIDSLGFSHLIKKDY
jgi:predicted glycosyltransferase involved in capsule biosynthesis